MEIQAANNHITRCVLTRDKHTCITNTHYLNGTRQQHITHKQHLHGRRKQKTETHITHVVHAMTCIPNRNLSPFLQDENRKHKK